MIRNVLLFIYLWALTSCSTLDRKPAQTRTVSAPRHVIFLIHGVGGNASHFGEMPAALKSQLNTLDGDRYRYEVQTFEYETENDQKNIFDFSLALDSALERTFQSGIGPDDRISFVAHSQGGLVTTVWLLQAFQSAPGYHTKFADHVESVVTLATPYWGAKIAGFTVPLKEKLTKILAPFRVGKKQLEHMSFGSDMIYWLRQKVQQFKPFKQVRVLNIGSYVKWLNGLPGTLGTKVYEDDSAVILPSSQANFYSGQLIKLGYTENETSSVTEFKETLWAKYKVVNAIHLSPVVSLPQLSRGIAQVQSDCITNLNCDHPAFKFVVDHIRNRSVSEEKDDSSLMTSFLLDVNVALPTGSHLNPNEIKIQFEIPDDIEIGRTSELMSQGKSVSKKNNMIRFYYTGVIKSEAGQSKKRERTVFMKVTGEGYKTRIIEVPVKAMQSTFIELNVEPRN